MIRRYFARARERSWKAYSKYYGHDGYRHHEARYLDEITRHLTADSLLLDAGAGMDMVFTRQIAPKVRMAIGTDIGELKRLPLVPMASGLIFASFPSKTRCLILLRP